MIYLLKSFQIEMSSRSTKLFLSFLLFSLLCIFYQIIQIYDLHNELYNVKSENKITTANKKDGFNLNTIVVPSTQTVYTKEEEEQIIYLKSLKTEANAIAAISVAIPNKDNAHEAWVYVFYLPLTVKSWLQLGYHVTIHVVVDFNSISSEDKQLLQIVIKSLLRFKLVSVYYFDVKSTLKFRLSQLLRIYSAHIGNFNINSFLLLSDSDLWPLQKSRLELSTKQRVLITNSNCCGSFRHGNKTYKHLPMAHIGMSISNWIELFPLKLTRTNSPVTNHIKDLPLLISHGPYRNYFTEDNVKPLLLLMEQIFGKGIYNQAIHGGPLWGIDQMHVSMAIDKYRDKHGDSEIKFVPHWSCMRVDRAYWEGSVQMKKCKADAHLLHGEVWGGGQWRRLMLLMKTTFDESEIERFELYRKSFSSTYKKFKSL